MSFAPSQRAHADGNLSNSALSANDVSHHRCDFLEFLIDDSFDVSATILRLEKAVYRSVETFLLCVKDLHDDVQWPAATVIGVFARVQCGLSFVGEWLKQRKKE
jgi:hypothetical protein